MSPFFCFYVGIESRKNRIGFANTYLCLGDNRKKVPSKFSN